MDFLYANEYAALNAALITEERRNAVARTTGEVVTLCKPRGMVRVLTSPEFTLTVMSGPTGWGFTWVWTDVATR